MFKSKLRATLNPRPTHIFVPRNRGKSLFMLQITEQQPKQNQAQGGEQPPPSSSHAHALRLTTTKSFDGHEAAILCALPVPTLNIGHHSHQVLETTNHGTPQQLKFKNFNEIVTSGSDKCIRVWNVQTTVNTTTIANLRHTATCLAWWKYGCNIYLIEAGYSSDIHIRLWNLKPKRYAPDNEDDVPEDGDEQAAAFPIENRSFVSFEQLYKHETCPIMTILKSHDYHLCDIQVIETRDQLVTIGQKLNVQVWNLRTGEALLQFKCTDAWYYQNLCLVSNNSTSTLGVADSSNYSLIASFGKKNSICFHNVETGDLVHEVPNAHTSRLLALLYVPREHVLVSTGFDYCIKVWTVSMNNTSSANTGEQCISITCTLKFSVQQQSLHACSMVKLMVLDETRVLVLAAKTILVLDLILGKITQEVAKAFVLRDNTTFGSFTASLQ